MTEQTKHFYEFGAFQLDASNRLLLRGGKVVPLKPKVVETLLVLVEKNGNVVGKDELHDALWKHTFVEEGNLTQNIYLLRKALSDESSESRFIETIPRRGYRFVADVKERIETLPPSASEMTQAKEDDSVFEKKEEPAIEKILLISTEEANHAPQHSIETLTAPPASLEVRHLSKKLIIIVASISIIALAGFFYVRMSGKTQERGITTTAGNVKSIAVLPFKSLTPETEDFIGAGMADALIAKLGGVENFRVPPTSAVLKYADRATDSLAAGRELNMDTVLDGSIQRSQNSIRITARLIRVSDGASLWAGQFDENFTNVFAVQDSISEQVTRALTLRLNEEEQKRLNKHYTENAAAYEAYLKGRYFWNKRTVDGYIKGIEYFQKSIALDANYAHAYAGLADCYMRLNEGGILPPSEATVPRAKAAALKALSIDDSLAEAHATLGFIYFRFDWDFAAAERELKKSLELNANYAIAHQWYAFFLLTTDRQTEALVELNRARELDPLSLNIGSGFGTYFYFKRQYERAAEELKKTLEMDSNFAEAHWTLGLVYEQQGLSGKSAEEFKKLQDMPAGSGVIAALAHLYATSGNPDEARRILNELLEKSKDNYVSAYDIAVIHAGLGEQGEAIKWLEKSYAEQNLRPAWAKLDPRLDSLRSLRRFQNLIKR